MTSHSWRPDEEFPVLRELREIAERHLGPIDDRRHGLGDPGPLMAALRDAGFQDIQSKRISRNVHFADGSVFARLNATALVSMSAGSADLNEEARQRIVAAIAQDSEGLVKRHTGAEGFVYEIGTNVTCARV